MSDRYAFTSIKLVFILLLGFGILSGCDRSENHSIPIEEPGPVYTPRLLASRAPGQITLTWGWLVWGSSLEPGQSAPSYFRLYHSDVHPDSLKLFDELGEDVTSVSLENFEEGSIHFFQIEAVESEDNTAKSEVVMIQVGNPSLKKEILANHSVPTRNAAWASNGRKIAFESGTPGNTDIYTYDLETTANQEAGKGVYPDWNPVDATISYHTLADSSPTTLLTAIQTVNIDASFSMESIFGGDAFYRQAQWSTDGENMIFVSNIDQRDAFYLYSYNPEEGYPPTLVSAGQTPPVSISSPEKRGPAHPTWFPFSKAIAFDQYTEKFTAPNLVRDIFLINIPSNATFPLIESRWDDYCPAFSPFGDQVAFISNRSGKPEIWVKNMETGSLKMLTGDLEGIPLYHKENKLDWSPDGSSILFTGWKNEDLETIMELTID